MIFSSSVRSQNNRVSCVDQWSKLTNLTYRDKVRGLAPSAMLGKSKEANVSRIDPYLDFASFVSDSFLTSDVKEVRILLTWVLYRFRRRIQHPNTAYK